MDTKNIHIMRLYQRFFRENPDQENPTDLNTIEKFMFAITIGFENLRRMEQSRKNGDPWTKKKYWMK